MSIFYQDIKERSVYWFLFPIVTGTAGYLYFSHTFAEFFWRTTFINLASMLTVLLVLQTYAKLKLKTNLLAVFGLGDALLFLALCTAFPSITFVIFFAFSLLFSLILHFVLKSKMKTPSVPLAGYMSLFYLGIYLLYWTGLLTNMYSM
ncbi:MAG: hypothetical protein AAF617_17445 [Bacteroidota bacterium]